MFRNIPEISSFLLHYNSKTGFFEVLNELNMAEIPFKQLRSYRTSVHNRTQYFLKSTFGIHVDGFSMESVVSTDSSLWYSSFSIQLHLKMHPQISRRLVTVAVSPLSPCDDVCVICVAHDQGPPMHTLNCHVFCEQPLFDPAIRGWGLYKLT